MSELSPARAAGFVYVLYFVVAIGSGVLARGDIASLMRGSASVAATAVWIASTLIYAVVVVLLGRLLWDVDPRLALAAIVLGLVGCAIQSVVSVRDLGRYGPVVALFFFGLFMVVYGSLIIRSTAMPSALGFLYVLGGIGSCSLVIPGFPPPLAPAVYGLGGIAEISLAAWLVARG